MSARKPQSLKQRHDTKADKEARLAAEAAFKPARPLPKEPPPQLAGHDVARATWRETMRTYGELEAQVADRLDLGLLIDYCLLVEQVGEMDKVAAIARAAVAKTDEDESETWSTLQAIDMVVKLDARTDRKRALLLQMRQSLYLTPRSRAGVQPPRKEAPEPEDELERLLKGVDLGTHGK